MLIKQQRSQHHPLKRLLQISILAITLTAFYLIRNTIESNSINKDTLSFIESILKNQSKEERGQEREWKYCQVEEIVRGTWESRRDFKDLKEVWEAFGLKSGADSKCEISVPLTTEQQPESAAQLGFERIKAVAIPELSPEGGCRMLEMDRRRMLRRLLRSLGGLTIVGDSISEKTFQIWADMLAVDPGLITRTRHSDSHQSLKINPESKHATALREEAGVSIDRFAYPVVSFYRHDQLLSKDDLGRVMQDAEEGRVEVKMDKDQDWFGDWQRMLKESSGVVRVEAGREETSLIVLNTGAFWTTKSLGSKVKEEDVDIGYQNMFNIMKGKIREVPYPVASYWRSLTPAHLDCAASTSYNNSKADWSSPISGATNSWNYHWYQRMNGIAEGNTVHQRSQRAWNFKGIKTLRDINPPMRYIDVWEMSLKRPEAHLRPPQDCLGFCTIGVMNYWQQLLWNVVVQESRNVDYDPTDL